jgi:hypothetical protein
MCKVTPYTPAEAEAPGFWPRCDDGGEIVEYASRGSWSRVVRTTARSALPLTCLPASSPRIETVRGGSLGVAPPSFDKLRMRSVGALRRKGEEGGFGVPAFLRPVHGEKVARRVG